jgi:hypothetical protein
MKVWGSGGTASPFLFSVSFTPRLYSHGNRPRYPFHRRLGVPQIRSVDCGEGKNIAPAGIGIPDVQPKKLLTTILS